MGKRKHTKEEIKYLKKFYGYISDRYKHDNNVWDYIQALFDEYVNWDRSIFIYKEDIPEIPQAPQVMAAVFAIEEKRKIKSAESPEDYKRFQEEMDAIDKKYGFLADTELNKG